MRMEGTNSNYWTKGYIQFTYCYKLYLSKPTQCTPTYSLTSRTGGGGLKCPADVFRDAGVEKKMTRLKETKLQHQSLYGRVSKLWVRASGTSFQQHTAESPNTKWFTIWKQSQQPDRQQQHLQNSYQLYHTNNKRSGYYRNSSNNVNISENK